MTLSKFQNKDIFFTIDNVLTKTNPEDNLSKLICCTKSWNPRVNVKHD